MPAASSLWRMYGSAVSHPGSVIPPCMSHPLHPSLDIVSDRISPSVPLWHSENNMACPADKISSPPKHLMIHHLQGFHQNPAPVFLRADGASSSFLHHSSREGRTSFLPEYQERYDLQPVSHRMSLSALSRLSCNISLKHLIFL